MGMLASMTGFGRSEGTGSGVAWAWELRSVNGRGLDLKMRLPAGFEALEAGLREEAGRVLRRGNVGASLSIKREDRARLVVDPDVLDDLLRLAEGIASRVPGVPPPRAELLLALPGVMRMPSGAKEGGPEEGVAPAVLDAVRAGFGVALAALAAARGAEGGRLGTVLGGQLDEVVALREAAEGQAADQPRLQQARLMDSLQGLLRDQPGLPAERIAQEVALLATRSDVREELDRLAAHLEAARGLLAEGAGVGRRLDFLVQEFVRETNTLCAKSASVPLTATGLRLKATIEQIREQVQNVE